MHTATNLFSEEACELSVHICGINKKLAMRIKIIVRIDQRFEEVRVSVSGRFKSVSTKHYFI